MIWKNNTSHLEELWLEGNVFECGCDMLWMVDWLSNLTTPSGKRLVRDYKDVICKYGQEIGTPVYQLNPVKMGCYLNHSQKWIINAAAGIGCFVFVLVISVLLIYQQRRLVRWFIYKNFDKLLGDPDRNEDITGMEFDAFLSFRYEHNMSS